MTVVQNKNSKISSWGLGSWDPATKEHMMAYDNKQLKDFTTMYDEETILYEGMRI